MPSRGRYWNPNQPWQEVKRFCRTRVIPMPAPQSVTEWEAYAERVREDTLRKVVFRGEAEKWRRLPLNVEWLDTVEGGPEYVIRKLRFESVPGL